MRGRPYKPVEKAGWRRLLCSDHGVLKKISLLGVAVRCCSVAYLVLALPAIICGSLPLCKSGRIAVNLANIVHDTVEQPLRVHLALAAQRERSSPSVRVMLANTGSAVARCQE
jgi:hypothetical protein